MITVIITLYGIGNEHSIKWKINKEKAFTNVIPSFFRLLFWMRCIFRCSISGGVARYNYGWNTWKRERVCEREDEKNVSTKNQVFASVSVPWTTSDSMRSTYATLQGTVDEPNIEQKNVWKSFRISIDESSENEMTNWITAPANVLITIGFNDSIWKPIRNGQSVLSPAKKKCWMTRAGAMGFSMLNYISASLRGQRTTTGEKRKKWKKNSNRLYHLIDALLTVALVRRVSPLAFCSTNYVNAYYLK